jgi:large subunit ribosomal protein L27Ae
MREEVPPPPPTPSHTLSLPTPPPLSLPPRSHPGYFGKVGMRYFHKTKNPSFVPTVNVDNLWHLLGAEALAKAQASKGEAPVIDVTDHGYFKVLGKGLLPKLPIVVKARFVSAIAEKKIKAAGGAVILTA